MLLRKNAVFKISIEQITTAYENIISDTVFELRRKHKYWKLLNQQLKFYTFIK